MRTKLRNKKRSGTFTISPGMDIHGELTLDGAKTLLYLRDEQYFSPLDIGRRTLKGILHDLTKVSLIDCVTPPVASHTIRNIEADGSGAQYYHANIFSHFVVCGDGHLDDDEAAIASVNFLLDDASVLFHDHDAFGLVFDGARFINQLASAANLGRQIATGPDARIMYFAGRRDIFSVETAFGTISAWHNLVRLGVGTRGVRMEARVRVSIAFREPIAFHETIQRVYRLIAYLGLIVGRPQNLVRLDLESERIPPLMLEVRCSMPPKRNLFSESEKPSSFDVLLDGVRNPEDFSNILKRWLDREKEWHDARWRFFNSFAHQKHYDIDRLIAAANMFDILPDSAVPSDVLLTAEERAAQSECRRLFRALPPSPGRDSILGALGRMGKSSLKHKVRHRAQRLIGLSGQAFPQLLMVTDEAVNCRNYYVHGGIPRFAYEKNFDLVVFFTDTLEFVFATSDLIDAGWDIQSWAARPTSMSHPFGRYRVCYNQALKLLSSALSQVDTRA